MNNLATIIGKQSQEIIIEAGRTERQYWRDLWNYRELFFFLAWRDILVRYKQTIIGILWALIRPLLIMVVLTVVFGKWAKMPSEGVPYPILVFAAMLPWQFFANSFTGASNSLITNTNLISKVYFPRLVIPTSSVVVSFVDFLISLAILFALMVGYDFCPTWRITALPFLILIAIGASLGAGFYISPVGFSTSAVPDQWRWLYALNPMVGVIDGFRWAILGKDSLIYLPGFILSIGLVILFFFYGLKYFRKTERTFADII